MNKPKNALVLVGSPKPKDSKSEALGQFLLDKLKEKGLETEIISLRKALKSGEGISEMLSAVNRTDLIILSSPLYIDSSPYIVIKAMELINKNRKSKEPSKKRLFFAISNCGFPEPLHNDTALAIYRRFAIESGFEWTGGLGLSSMSDATGALEITVDALAEGKTIPEEAQNLVKLAIQIDHFAEFANKGWDQGAKMQGVENLRSRPYEE